jgi:hypothetical protein
MVTPSYTVTCTYKKLIAPGVYEFAFTKPEGFTFKAGQFVLFDVPLLTNPTDMQARAYSIASTPEDLELLFAIKIVPGGRMSTFVEEALREGTTLTMKGPFGVFEILRSGGDGVCARLHVCRIGEQRDIEQDELPCLECESFRLRKRKFVHAGCDQLFVRAGDGVRGSDHKKMVRYASPVSS